MAQTKELTATDLKTIVNAEVQEVLKGEGLKSVLEMIQAQIEAKIAPLREEATNSYAKLFGAITGGQKTEPPKREKGMAFGRVVRAISCAKRFGNGPQDVARILTQWGDADLAEAQKAAEGDFDTFLKVLSSSNSPTYKALAASIAGDGGYLVAPQFSTDILENRKAATVVRRAGPRELPMPTGTLHLPKVTSGVLGGYIGENANLPASQPVFGENILTFKKLAVLTPISNDLLRYNSPSSDAVVRDDIVRSLAVSEDIELLRGDGTSGGPKGLRYWAIAANIVAASTASLANVTTDLVGMITRMVAAKVPITKGVWFISPRTWGYLYSLRDGNGNYAFKGEMDGGTLMSYPFYRTQSIPNTLTVGANSDCSEITFANMDDCAIGDSERLMIDVSSEAAYHNGSSVVAAFSLDQTVIRAIAEHDFAVRDPNAVGILTGVRWGV